MTNENELVFDDTNSITIRWHISDVQRLRSDLTDEQAMQVLRLAQHKLNANVGLHWAVLEYPADDLLPGHPRVDSEGDQGDVVTLKAPSSDAPREPSEKEKPHHCLCRASTRVN